MISSKSHKTLSFSLYFLSVQGEHLPVKTGICRSYSGSMFLLRLHAEKEKFVGGMCIRHGRVLCVRLDGWVHK